MRDNKIKRSVGQPAEKLDQEFQDRVARKAYELFERRGRIPGHDVEDWLEAERLVRTKRGKR